VDEANAAMMGTFGGNWASVAQAEMLSAGLTKAKYNNGEPPDLHAIYNAFQTTAQAKIIAEFQKELSNQAKAYTLTPLKNTLTGGKNDSASNKFINTALDTAFKDGIAKTTDAQVKSLYQKVEGNATSVVKEIATEATYDYGANASGSSAP
jgi:hypothetical protein